MELSRYNAFAEEAGINDEYAKRRKPQGGIQMAEFEIVFGSEDHYKGQDKPLPWWWDEFIGIKFIGEIKWKHGTKEVKEVSPISMIKNVYYIKGRDIPMDCLIMK